MPPVPVRMYRAAAIAPASAAFCSARRIVSVNPRSITSAAMTSSVSMPPGEDDEDLAGLRDDDGDVMRVPLLLALQRFGDDGADRDRVWG